MAQTLVLQEKNGYKIAAGRGVSRAPSRPNRNDDWSIAMAYDAIHPTHMPRNTSGESANRIGRAGEHIVIAELLMAGHEAFLCEGKAPFDIAALIGGRLVRIQVKTTAGFKQCPQRKHSTPVYAFSARKVGKLQRQGYAEGDADLVAYVALDRRAAAYMPAEKIAQSTTLRIRAFEDQYYCKTGMFFEDFPLSKALGEINAG
jgi:hypothetical protein